MIFKVSKFIQEPRLYARFASDTRWCRQRVYSMFEIVRHAGSMYTSICVVPSGIDITNADYWVKTS